MRAVRLRSVARVSPSNVDKKTVDGEEPVQLCNYTDVYYNDFIHSGLKFMSATATSHQIRSFSLDEGDVLITKDSETPDDIAVPSLVVEDMFGVLCGYHLALIRPNLERVDARFLFRALSSGYVNRQFAVAATGITRHGLRTDAIRDARIPLPNLRIQRRIADFLDRETDRIDALIDTKRRLIDLLAEKRTALITHAVTKGLDPTVPTKDSGIPWIGEIPAHWGISSISHVVDSISDGPFGSSLASKHYSASGTRVVRLGNLGQGEFLTEDAAYILDHYAEVLDAHLLRPGDLLMAGLGDERRSLGRTVVVPPEILPAIHKADCFRLRPSRLMLGAFLASYMSSNAGSASAVALAQGTTRHRINTTIARSLPVPVPPMTEQQAIDTFLNDKRSPFERTTKNLAIQLDLLAEYRQALITAAVTGQLDEETLKGREPADEVLDVEVPS